ncbi:hypothetical protein STEG23_002984 [Scotinomys teguina]
MFSTLRKHFSFKKEQKTPLGFCDGQRSEKGYLSCFCCEMKYRYFQRYNPANQFHKAVCKGKLKVVQHQLIEQSKFDVNEEDEGKRPALHFACFYGHLNLVIFLLLKECDINALDNTKSTPLMKAVQSRETEIVSVLLHNGADHNVKDCKGGAAIHQAFCVDIPAVASNLLDYGANMEDTTKDGFTPLLLALREQKPHIAKYLIRHGANLHACDEYKRTTLMYAVKWDREDIVELLLQRGVDYQSRDTFGWNALYYATVGKRKASEELEIQTLLEYETVSHKSEDYQKLIFTQSSNTGNGREEYDIIQVWAEKCLHPELRDYSHQISKPRSEAQQSETVKSFSEGSKEEIAESELENERSFDDSAENQEFDLSWKTKSRPQRKNRVSTVVGELSGRLSYGKITVETT